MTCQFCNVVGKLENHVCERSIFKETIEDLEKKWVCTFCNCMAFESEQEYNEHNQSYNHVLCVLNSEKKSDEIVEELRHWYCVECKKQYRDNKEYTDHFFKEEHLRVSQVMSTLGDNINLFTCNICNVTLTQDLERQHQADPQHIKASLKQETVKKLTELANEDVSTISYTCNYCQTGTLSFVQYSDHLLGERHMRIMVNLELFRLKSSMCF